MATDLKEKLQKDVSRAHGFVFTREIDEVGRLVIPVDVRRACGWNVGDTLMIAAVDDGIVIKRPEDMYKL